MSTDLATMSSKEVGRRSFSDVVDVVQHLDQLWNLADILVKSRMLPNSIATPEAAVAIMLKGRELGIGAMAAFAGITVIQGKPVVSPQLMLSLINRDAVLEDMRIEDDGQCCRVTMKRHGRTPHTAAFSMEDARAMQLAGKDNWKKMPGVMRQWRAVAACARIVCPDVIDGMYTPEEMGAEVNEDGEILEGEVVAPAGQKFPDQGSGHGRSGSYAHDEHDAAFKKALTEAGARLSGSWQDSWATANGGELPPGLPAMPVRSHEVISRLFARAVESGKLQPVEMTADENTGQPVPKASIEQMRKMVAVVYARDPAGTLREAGRFMERRAMEVAVDFIDANRGFNLPDDFDPEMNILDDDRPEEASQEEPVPLPAPAAPRKMGKKELAESVRKRLQAEAAARAASVPADRGDAYEDLDEALANSGRDA